MSNKNGQANASTGRTHAISDCPLANQTTISESRYWREIVSSTDTNTVNDNNTGK